MLLVRPSFLAAVERMSPLDENHSLSAKPSTSLAQQALSSVTDGPGMFSRKRVNSLKSKLS